MISSCRFSARATAMSVLALLLATGGCRGGDGDHAGKDARAGVREGVVDLTIAEVEGKDEYTFGRISGVAVDKAGRIYVADGQSNDVRVFGPDGRFIYRIGRAG